jgi:hypothetical protein
MKMLSMIVESLLAPLAAITHYPDFKVHSGHVRVWYALVLAFGCLASIFSLASMAFDRLDGIDVSLWKCGALAAGAFLVCRLATAEAELSNLKDRLEESQYATLTE